MIMIWNAENISLEMIELDWKTNKDILRMMKLLKPRDLNMEKDKLFVDKMDSEHRENISKSFCSCVFR